MRQGAQQPATPGVGDRRRASRRPLSAGLALSALAHLLVVVLYPFLGGSPARQPGVLVAPEVREVGGMRAVRIVEIPAADVGDPNDPIEIEDPDQPDIDPEAPSLESEFEVYIPGRRPSPGERLRIGEGDPRLWQPVDREVLAPTPHELVELRLLAAIEADNDSAFAEAERLAQSLDWTHTDDQGRRWGVSPGRIHLGDTEIPLPFGFGPPPDYNGDQADWAFRMADIDRAAGSLAVRMSWQERVEVMRRRREARRAAEEAERQRPPPVVKPDTTGASRRR